MLKSLIASKAAKLMTACVCPVVGATALTVAVPQVRDAVHKATAPRAYAKPKTRVRSPLADNPALASAAIAPCPTAVPVVFSDISFDQKPQENLPPFDKPLPHPGPPESPPFFPSTPGTPTTPDNSRPPLLPEPTTWMQMILGFGLIGGAVRTAQRRRVRKKVLAPVGGGIRPESDRPFT